MAGARGARRRLAAPAIATVVIKRRRVGVACIGNLPILLRSRLQLAFEFVEEAPIGVFGDVTSAASRSAW